MGRGRHKSSHGRDNASGDAPEETSLLPEFPDEVDWTAAYRPVEPTTDGSPRRSSAWDAEPPSWPSSWDDVPATPAEPPTGPAAHGDRVPPPTGADGTGHADTGTRWPEPPHLATGWPSPVPAERPAYTGIDYKLPITGTDETATGRPATGSGLSAWQTGPGPRADGPATGTGPLAFDTGTYDPFSSTGADVLGADGGTGARRPGADGGTGAESPWPGAEDAWAGGGTGAHRPDVDGGPRAGSRGVDGGTGGHRPDVDGGSRAGSPGIDAGTGDRETGTGAGGPGSGAGVPGSDAGAAGEGLEIRLGGPPAEPYGPGDGEPGRGGSRRSRRRPKERRGRRLLVLCVVAVVVAVSVVVIGMRLASGPLTLTKAPTAGPTRCAPRSPAASPTTA